jgi:hypothetical protein
VLWLFWGCNLKGGRHSPVDKADILAQEGCGDLKSTLNEANNISILQRIIIVINHELFYIIITK